MEGDFQHWLGHTLNHQRLELLELLFSQLKRQAYGTAGNYMQAHIIHGWRNLTLNGIKVFTYLYQCFEVWENLTLLAF